MKKNNIPIVLNISESLKEALAIEAKKFGLGLSTYIRMVLLKTLEDQKKDANPLGDEIHE